jgi:hypothetical protein
VILRTWTAYDACGNTAVGAQTITVVDVGHVALLLPADLTVPCGDPTSPEATGWASASDPDATDEPPSVTYDDVAILDPCTGAGTILRTWAATDACGNAVSAVQSITVGGSCVARVIISEIAWAGTTANSPDEWIELRNMSDESVDLEGWTLRWRLAKPATREDEAWKTLRLHGVLAPAQRHQGLLLHTSASRPATWWLDLADLRPAPDYLLAERISDATVSNVLAGVVYDDRLEEERALELSDEGEIVELIAPGGCVVDSANAERMGVGGWAAGSAATHGTMERTDALRGDVEANWHTNLGLITHGIDADGLSLVATAGTDNQPLIERLPTMEFLDLISVRRGNSIELRLPARAFLGDPRVPRVLAFESGDADPIPPPVDVSMADTSLVVVASESARTGDYDVWVRAGEVVVPVPLRVDP